MAEKTLFEKILSQEIPGNILYEDDLCFVLNDINPQAPVHVLVIPKKPIVRLGEATDEDSNILGHLMMVVSQQAKALDVAEGFRVTINNGLLAGETVPHLHVHLLGGRPFSWPPG